MNNKIFYSVLAAAMVLFGCQKFAGKSPVIGQGSTVKFHYTLKVEGAVVDSSANREPLTYVHGSGKIVPGLESEMLGLKKGDKKNVSVSPEKGYGMSDPKAIQKVPKSAFKNTKELKVGSQVSGQSGGRNFQAKIEAIGKTDITLNFNHPLAGKTLNFDIEVIEVQPAAG